MMFYLIYVGSVLIMGMALIGFIRPDKLFGSRIFAVFGFWMAIQLFMLAMIMESYGRLTPLFGF